MPKCPICQTALETTRQREGVFYPCRACNGRAVTVSQIRHVLGESVAMKLLRLMKLSAQPSPRECPFCSEPMGVLNSQEPPLKLDACRKCNVVWFDGPTYDCLPELAIEGTNSIRMQAAEIMKASLAIFTVRSSTLTFSRTMPQRIWKSSLAPTIPFSWATWEIEIHTSSWIDAAGNVHGRSFTG